MKTLWTELGRALAATIFFAVILCGVYPLIVFALAQMLFPRQANGSLFTDSSGATRGSALLAQPFSGPQYFHPRPSANRFDAADSGGSNLGPTSARLAAEISQRIADYRRENNLPANTAVPADAVTASASGLDPDISPANAEIQVPRVAKARGLPEELVRALVRQNTRGRELGLFGQPRVNVVTLNFALDRLTNRPSTVSTSVQR